MLPDIPNEIMVNLKIKMQDFKRRKIKKLFSGICKFNKREVDGNSLRTGVFTEPNFPKIHIYEKQIKYGSKNVG